MISWYARIKGQAGDWGQAGVRPSPDIITGTWLVMVHTAGDVAVWKTKQLLSTFTFLASTSTLPMRSSFVLIRRMIKYLHMCVLTIHILYISIYIYLCDLMVPVMEEWMCKQACNERLRWGGGRDEQRARWLGGQKPGVLRWISCWESCFSQTNIKTGPPALIISLLCHVLPQRFHHSLTVCSANTSL